MKNSYICYLVFVLYVFVSCTPEPLDIHLPEADEKPVVYSQFVLDTASNQSVFLVVLTRTLSVTKDAAPAINDNGIQVNPNYFITGAKVVLQTSGGNYELQEMGGGVYIAYDVFFYEGEVCTIKAIDLIGKLILAANTMVMPVKTFSSVYVSKMQQHYTLDFVIEDKPNQANWYVVNYFTKQEKDSSGKFNDPNYIALKLIEQKLDFDLFTDKDFINGKIQVSKKIPQISLDSMAVAVTEISEGYYQFLTVQKRYGKLINQLKGEAMQFPTNINGGLGYFNVTQPQVYVLPIKNN